MSHEPEDVRALWEQFNSLEVESMLHYTGVEILTKIMRVCQESEKHQYQREIDLAWTIHVVGMHLEHFRPDMKLVNQAISKFSEKHQCDAEYYQTRLNTARTSLLKWHYALACYFLLKGEYLKNAIDHILRNSESARKESEYLNYVELLVLSYSLNKIYGLGLDEKIKNAALDAIEKVKDEPRYLQEPVEILVRLKMFKDGELNNLIELLQRKSDESTVEHIKEDLLRKAAELCGLDKRSRKDAKIEILTKIATRFEELGDQNTEGLLKIHHYEQALKEYQKIENIEKISQISKKIRDSYEKIEWQKFEHKFTIPKMTIPGNSGYERVISIANFADMIPDLHKTIEQTKDLMKQFPIASLFARTAFNQEQPVSHSNTDEEEFRARIKEELLFSIRLSETVLSSNVNELEKENKIKQNDYYDFIKSFGLHDESSLNIIKNGIERHFANDFVSAIHNLIPQVEYTIRELLKSRGIHITRLKGDIIQNILLDTLIERGRAIFGENLTEYLLIKFTDIEGMNQRNDVCHGNAKLGLFTHATSLSLIYVVMVLSKLTVEKK